MKTGANPLSTAVSLALAFAGLIVRHRILVVLVLLSWSIVVAVLAAALHLLPVTPGYLPDHLE